MKIFLAGQSSYCDLDWSNCKYNLESFYYFKKEQIPYLKKWESFLLDSGAFTFMQKSKKCDWIEYVENYSEFINKHDIKYFFELDIDNIIGYEKVLQLRKFLEKKQTKKVFRFGINPEVKKILKKYAKSTTI